MKSSTLGGLVARHAACVVVFAVALASLAEAAEAKPGASLTGHWNVIASPIRGGVKNCVTKNEASVYQWLVAENGAKVTVTVVGRTAFPGLVGRRSGRTVRLDSASKDRRFRIGSVAFFATSYFDLRLDGNKLVGKRYFVGYRHMVKNRKIRPCLVRQKVVATRQ